MALAELVKLGQCEAMEKMLEAAEMLEKNKTGTASGLQAGVVMAEVLYFSTVFLMSRIFSKHVLVVKNIFRCCSTAEMLRVRAS